MSHYSRVSQIFHSSVDCLDPRGALILKLDVILPNSQAMRLGVEGYITCSFMHRLSKPIRELVTDHG